MNERDFKWIRIPKEIWLSKELTIQEKIMFVEISSLDNESWCYATNSYFAEFFWLSEDRISRIISSLHKRWYISVDIDKANWNTRIIHTLSLNPPIGENTQSYNRNNNINNKAKKEKIIYIKNKTELLSLIENNWITNELYILWIMIDLWYKLSTDKQEIENGVARVKSMMSRYIPRKEDWKLDWNKAKAETEDRYIYWSNPPKWKKKPTNFQLSLTNWVKPKERKK
jgi:hypothetical protein